MVDASDLANTIKNTFMNIFERKNRPQLVLMAICIPMFQILTGINSILFYAPILFGSLGFGANAFLYSSVLTGFVLVLSTLVSIATVESWGHKPLLLFKIIKSKPLIHTTIVDTEKEALICITVV